MFILFFFCFWGGGQRKHVLDKRFDRTITVAFYVIGLFCFCFFWGGGGGGKKSFYVATLKIALRFLKLPFNPQFKYMTFMYQQHM